MHNLKVTTPGPHREFEQPDFALPEGSCDSHVHIFGPHEKFPFSSERTFTPEDVPLEELREMHETMGFKRSVLVQSAAHGSNHDVLIDALERHQGAYKATALLKPDVSAAEVERLNAAGFCGARIHFAPHLGTPMNTDQIMRLSETIGQFNWHLQVHTMGSGLAEIAEFISRLPLRVVLDHMGRFDYSLGSDAPGMTAIRDLFEGNDFWVKLSGADRISAQLPSMSDGLALAREIFMMRPDRCVWGSDFPHPNTHGFVPWDHQLVNGIMTIAPTDEERELLLVSNPTECFDF